MSLVSDWNNIILLERENLATFLSFGDNSRIVILPGLQEENEGYVKSCFARHLYLPALGRVQRNLWATTTTTKTDGKHSDGQGLVL